MTNTKHVEPNATQDVQSIGCVGDYISRQAAIDEIYHHFPSLSHTEAAMVLHTVPTADVVPRSIFEQVKWERDVAMKQLEDLGIGFGEEVKDVVEVVRCKDCKYFIKDEPCVGGTYDCCYMMSSDETEENAFCSYGERKNR